MRRQSETHGAKVTLAKMILGRGNQVRARLGLVPVAALGVLCLLASACGGSDQPGEIEPQEASTPGGPQFLSPVSMRPSEGISASGGRLRSGAACPEPEPGGSTAQAADTIKIAWVGPNVERLASIGLETLILDEPSLVVDAYISEVNRQGGIGGTCFELVKFMWDVSDPDMSFQDICSELPQEQPLVLLSLLTNNAVLRCATLGSMIPTVGIFTSLPEGSLASAEGRLFIDDGSYEHLLSVTMTVAAAAEELTAEDRIGLLVTDRNSAASEIETAARSVERLGLHMATVAAVPSEFGTVGVSVAEREVRLMQTGLSDSEIEEAVLSYAELLPAQVATLRSLERFFVDTVTEMQRSGVTAVVTSASPADVRRLMRAADQLDWLPRWITTDSQPSMLTLTDAPKRQAQSLVQVSSRRAASDRDSDLDRGCVSLRNTSVAAEQFTHRTHTDAWSLLTTTCDYLDVVFGAMTRTEGSLTRDALLVSLSRADYETAWGSRIRFAPDDRNGSDHFRILRADPYCVLNSWGCMRADSRWYAVNEDLALASAA